MRYQRYFIKVALRDEKLGHSFAFEYRARVELLRRALTIVLVAIWPLAVIHCKLESISGFEFLHCAADSPGKSDCQDDGCQTVEGATYKNPDHRNILPNPVVFAVFLAVYRSAEPQFEKESVLPSLIPPELPSTWQFSSRAAPPVRAPSFVS
jgi:hypothetical protein